MNINKYQIIKFFVILTLFLSISYAALNQELTISQYDVTSNLIPSCFDDYKIVHLSDLHYRTFGKSQSELISAVSNQNPDLIVMTGDMIDNRKTNYANTEALFSGISTIAPIYCVNGNHEEAYGFIEKMSALYQKYNITELRGTVPKLYPKKTHTEDEYIEICGFQYLNNQELLEYDLPYADPNHFTILLNHRTDIFDSLTSMNYNLILSGHTHGGVIRLPFVGGLIGNDKTFFPKYDCGLFTHGSTNMISSRGLGTTRNIPRIFNKPDLVVITLHSSK